MIVEIAGRPAEHVKAALETHVGVLKQVKDVSVHSINVSEPKEIEESEGIFTCFAEVDFEAETFLRISEIMFDFMPSSVEVLEPARVSLNIGEATALLNNIAGRMHRYDEIAKIAKIRTNQMAQKMQMMQQEIMKRGSASKGVSSKESKKSKAKKKSSAKKKSTNKKTKAKKK